MSTPAAEAAPLVALEAAWDLFLQLGRDLDRLAVKAEMNRAVRGSLSVPADRMSR